MSMHMLPHELLVNILDQIQDEELNDSILVNHTFRDIVQTRRHTAVRLDFFLSHPARHRRAVSHVDVLAQSPSASQAVRELTIVGLFFCPEDVERELRTALKNMVHLSRLDLRSSMMGIDPGREARFFEEFSPAKDGPVYLPKLVSLHVSDPSLLPLLAPRRPICTIQLSGQPTHVPAVGESSSCLAFLAQNKMQLTKLHLSVRGEYSDMMDFFARIPELFPQLETLALFGIAPNQPSGSKWLSWEELLTAFHQIARGLQSLARLRTLALAQQPHYPPTCSERGALPDLIASQTEQTGRAIVRDELPRLRRIELRWHGWMIDDGGSWAPLPHEQLSRLN